MNTDPKKQPIAALGVHPIASAEAERIAEYIGANRQRFVMLGPGIGLAAVIVEIRAGKHRPAGKALDQEKHPLAALLRQYRELAEANRSDAMGSDHTAALADEFADDLEAAIAAQVALLEAKALSHEARPASHCLQEGAMKDETCWCSDYQSAGVSCLPGTCPNAPEHVCLFVHGMCTCGATAAGEPFDLETATREELIEEVNFWDRKAGEEHAKVLAFEEALRWRPASELPKEQGDFLCCTKERGQQILTWDGISWDHDEHWLQNWEYWNAQVTHWRPLPKGPT